MSTTRLANTLLSGLVTRYHAVPSVRPQTTGQHQWGVAVLMIYLTEAQCSVCALMEAVLHDTAELYTGDVPFTVKRDNPELKAAFDRLEKYHRENDLLEEVGLCNRSRMLLKLCDTLEGLIWCACYEQVGGCVGPRWQEAYKKCTDKFYFELEKDYPGIWERANHLVSTYLSSPVTRNTTTS